MRTAMFRTRNGSLAKVTEELLSGDSVVLVGTVFGNENEIVSDKASWSEFGFYSSEPGAKHEWDLVSRLP
jgi:hypothetical protein